MLGSRDDESARQMSNILRMGGQSDNVSQLTGSAALYPVKEWRTQDIWSFLMACGSLARFPAAKLFADNFFLATLYKTRPGNVSGRRKYGPVFCTPALAMDARLLLFYVFRLNSTFLFRIQAIHRN